MIKCELTECPNNIVGTCSKTNITINRQGKCILAWA